MHLKGQPRQMGHVILSAPKGETVIPNSCEDRNKPDYLIFYFVVLIESVN